MTVRSISRLGLNRYRIEDFNNVAVEVSMEDTDLAKFARMLGFDRFYPDLEDMLDNVDLLVGTILYIAVEPESKPQPALPS